MQIFHIYIINIRFYLVQFEIKFDVWGFQKAKIARAVCMKGFRKVISKDFALKFGLMSSTQQQNLS